MTKTFCTIITADYYPYAQALLYSIRKFDNKIHFNILISDKAQKDIHKFNNLEVNVDFHFPDELCCDGIGKKIMDKYQKIYHDAFRWSMKPVFINYLLQKKGFEKVIYVDCDIFFFNDFSFLFELLDKYNILLTPHWRSKDPVNATSDFKFLFNHGLYNAGFIAANKHSIEAIYWWAEACLFSCYKGAFEGQYVDQAYLNILPIYFDKVKILKHQGCNVAAWNKTECKRVLQTDGSILINNIYPIVFIHFINNICREHDVLLSNYFDQYIDSIRLFSREIYEKEKNNRNLTNKRKPALQEIFFNPIKRQLRMFLLRLILFYKKFDAKDSIVIFSSNQCRSAWLTLILSKISDSSIINDPFNTKNGLFKLKYENQGFTNILSKKNNENQKVMINKILAGKEVNYWTTKWSSWKSFLSSDKLVLRIENNFELLSFLKKSISLKHKPILHLCHPCAFALSQMYKSEKEINSDLEIIINEYQLITEDLIELMDSLYLPYEKLIFKWCLIHAKVINNIDNQRDYIVVYYENLILNPENELRRICAELSIDFKNNIKETLEFPCPLFYDEDENTDKEINADEWMSILSDSDHKIIEKILHFFDIKVYSSYKKMPIQE